MAEIVLDTNKDRNVIYKVNAYGLVKAYSTEYYAIVPLVDLEALRSANNSASATMTEAR